MFGGALVTVTTTYNQMQSRISENARQIVQLNAQISTLSNDSINAKVQLSDIQAQLKNIDTNILDVKQRLIEEGK